MKVARMDSDEWEDNRGPVLGCCLSPVTNVTALSVWLLGDHSFPTTERTPQQYWCRITFKHQHNITQRYWCRITFKHQHNTTQRYWCRITFKHHLSLSLQTSIQISNLSIRKELQDLGKRGYRWRKLHAINTNRIMMLKKKKEERCSKKAGQLYFFLNICLRKALFNKTCGKT